MLVFNDKEETGRKTQNGSSGFQGSRLTCGLLEYLWEDAWEVFGGNDIFDLMVIHSGIWKFSYSELFTHLPHRNQSPIFILKTNFYPF